MFVTLEMWWNLHLKVRNVYATVLLPSEFHSEN
jgi:hypothetical protein